MFSSKDSIKADYVSLSINDGAASVKATSRSVWRQWNQLSRFQRTIFHFAVITIVILVIYLLPGKTQNITKVQENDYDNEKIIKEHPKLLEVANEIKIDSVDQNKEAIDKGIGSNNVEVIDEPEFQPEINQVEDDQIREPPDHKSQPVKFDGIHTN